MFIKRGVQYPDVQLRHLQEKDEVTGYSMYKDLKTDCSRVVGPNISIISNSFHPSCYTSKQELEETKDYVNGLLKEGYEIFDSCIEYIGDEGGISSSQIVLKYNEDENRFDIGNIANNGSCTNTAEQRQYIFKKPGN